MRSTANVKCSPVLCCHLRRPIIWRENTSSAEGSTVLAPLCFGSTSPQRGRWMVLVPPTAVHCSAFCRPIYCMILFEERLQSAVHIFLLSPFYFNSENDLEEVLTFYTQKNKSSSVFLGTKKSVKKGLREGNASSNCENSKSESSLARR